MKFVNASLLVVLMTVCGSTMANTTDTKTVYIDAQFTAPSCDIQVPPYYLLGSLKPGEVKQHAPLTLNWSCKGSNGNGSSALVRTALRASVKKGNVLTTDNTKVELMLNNGNGSGAYLELRSNNNPIQFNSNQSDNFCQDSQPELGINMRQCSLTPNTSVSSQPSFGAVSALISFEVIYV